MSTNEFGVETICEAEDAFEEVQADMVRYTVWDQYPDVSARIMRLSVVTNEAERAALEGALRDTRLGEIGMERVEIACSQLKQGDVLPDLGIKVLFAEISPDGQFVEVVTNIKLIFNIPASQLIRVNRSKE